MSKTYTAGANAERTAIIAKVRRELKKCDGLGIPANLIDWLLARDTRYNKRPGGLGK